MTLNKIVGFLRQVYRDVDNTIARSLDQAARDGRPVSCGTCTNAGCCHMLTTISVAEGLTLADAVLQDPDWRALVPRLVSTARVDTAPNVTRDSRFRANVPCALLNTTTNKCTVYDVRPICCRTHNVVTDPALCTPDAPTARVGSVDLIEVEGAFWQVSTRVGDMLGVPATSQAPIALMLLACLDTLLDDRGQTADRDFVASAAKDLPDPLTWMLENIERLAKDPDGMDPNDPSTIEHNEKLVQISKKLMAGRVGDA